MYHMHIGDNAQSWSAGWHAAVICDEGRPLPLRPILIEMFFDCTICLRNFNPHTHNISCAVTVNTKVHLRPQLVMEIDDDGSNKIRKLASSMAKSSYTTPIKTASNPFKPRTSTSTISGGGFGTPPTSPTRPSTAPSPANASTPKTMLPPLMNSSGSNKPIGLPIGASRSVVKSASQLFERTSSDPAKLEAPISGLILIFMIVII
jgi:hypothetical protein